MPTNNSAASSLAIDALNPLSLQGVRSPLEINGPRSASSFAIVSGGTFTDNGSSNFVGVAGNPFDDARVYANGAVTINGSPLFSSFGNGLTLGPTGTLQNVSAAIAGSLKLGRVAEAVAIDIPAYLVPPIGAVERTIDVSQFPLNGAADVAGAFGGLGTVKWTGGSLSLPDATVLKNLTIVVENGDVNFNGDRHLLENVRLVVLNGSVNLGDVRAVNTSVYSAGGIRMNQGARFAGQNFLGTQNGDVIFNGATETIGGNDYVKVVAHGDVIFNAAANTRGDFWSTEDFFANRASTVLGSIRAKQSITFNAHVNVIGREFENQPLIGIIDTGFNSNNPDIDYGKIILGRDYIDNDNNPLLTTGTGNEHGTHILGIIGATQNNGIGIDGVNDKAPIWLGRSIGSGQWATSLTDYVNVVRQTDLKHGVVNLSLDLTQKNADGTVTTRYELTPQERVAIEYARQNNVLIVAAAGNTGGTMSALGQASQEFDNIVTVGSIDETDRRASYSGYGYGLDVMAYGGTIDKPVVSTVGSGADIQKIIDSLNQQWESSTSSSAQSTTDQVRNWFTDGIPEIPNSSQGSSGASSTVVDTSDLADDEMSINAKNTFNDVFGKFQDVPESDLAKLTAEEREVYENATQEIDKLLSAYLGDASQKMALEYVDGLYENQVNALSQFVEAFDGNMAETLIKAQDILKEAGYAVQLPQDQSDDGALDLGLGTMAGTSVATARVTGIASQVWASNPGLTYDQVKDILKRSAIDLGVPGWDPQTGSGKVNLSGAISLAQTTQPSDRKPQPIVSPLIWSGEGKLVPGERAVSYGVPAFTGNILNAGYVNQVGFLRIRSGPGQNFAEVGRFNPGTSVVFDAVEDNGSFVPDPYMPGGGSSRWYRIAGTNNWMSGLYLDNTPEQAAQERQRIEAIQKAEEEARKASEALKQAEEEARKAEEELRRIEAEQNRAEEELRRKREQFQVVVNSITQKYGNPGLLIGNWSSNGINIYQFSKGQLLVKPDGVAFYEAAKEKIDEIWDDKIWDEEKPWQVNTAARLGTILEKGGDFLENREKWINAWKKKAFKDLVNPGDNGFIIKNAAPKWGNLSTYIDDGLVSASRKLDQFDDFLAFRITGTNPGSQGFVLKQARFLADNPNLANQYIKIAGNGSRTAGKALGIVGNLLGIIPDAYEIISEPDPTGKRKKAVSAGLKTGGAALGATVGGFLGGLAGGVGAPVGIFLGGIAGDYLGGLAGDWVNNNWDTTLKPVTQTLENGWNSAVNGINYGIEAAKKKAADAQQAARELVEKAKSAYQSAQTTVQQAKVAYQAVKQEIAVRTTQIVQQAKQKMQAEAQAIVQKIVNNPVVKATSKVVNQVATYAKKAVQGVTNVINSVKQFVGNVVETGKQIVNNVIETAKQTYEAVKTFVVEKVEQGKQFVAEQYKNASQSVSNTWNNVSNGFNGLKSMFGW